MVLTSGTEPRTLADLARIGGRHREKLRQWMRAGWGLERGMTSCFANDGIMVYTSWVRLWVMK